MQRELSAEEVRGGLRRIVGSREWALSARMGQLLTYLVERTLAGEGGTLKETVVGVEVFGREPGYDPKVDPVVRVEARRLRLKLQEYYGGSGAGDAVRIELPKGTYQPRFEWARAEELAVAATGAEAAGRGADARWWVWAFVAVVVGTGVWMVWERRGEPVGQAGPPLQLTGFEWYSRAPSFSPDGGRVVFSRELPGRRSNLFVQEVKRGAEPRALTNGETLDYEPAWSRDGRTVAFLRETGEGRYALMLMPVGEGPVRERSLGEVGVRGPIDWSADGWSVLAADSGGAGEAAAIVAINVSDGSRRRVTSPQAGTAGDRSPRVSPDGKELAFVRWAETAVQDVYVMPLAGGEGRRLTKEEQVVGGLAWHGGGEELVVSLQRRGEPRSLWRVAVKGGEMKRLSEAGVGPVAPAVSARGGRLAYVSTVADTNIWRAWLAGGKAVEEASITSSVQMDTGPRISPDGAWVAWRSSTSGADEVWVARGDGSEARQLTRMNGPITGSARWSPDGQRIVFESRPAGNADLFVMEARGGAMRPLTSEKSNEVLPSFSQDGKSIYFSTDRAGVWEVWRMGVEGGEAVRVAGEGAFAPVESADGQWLYYTRTAGAQGIWRVPVSGGREELMTSELAGRLWGQWAVSAKGLFYAVFEPGGGARAIRRLDLATRKVSEVMELKKLPVQYDSGMSVAVDESWLAWSQLDTAGSIVYVVDGFR